jgi:glutathione S-transferase
MDLAGIATTRSWSWARARWLPCPCLLGDKSYLFGDAPCGADATAFGMAASILTPFFEAPLRNRAESHANLVAYCDRMMRQYYPNGARPWRRRGTAIREDADHVMLSSCESVSSESSLRPFWSASFRLASRA